MALAIAMYDFLGYYQVCYLGDEVADAARTIPRSIVISVALIAIVYLAMNVGILGVLPWRDVVRSEARRQRPDAARARAPGRRAGDGFDHLDGACFDLCGASGLQPRSRTRRRGRAIFSRRSRRSIRQVIFPIVRCSC